MSRPLVSVILPAWNSHSTLAACLESLRAQTFRDFEVIVVDSSAGARSAAIAREQFPEVRVRCCAERLGPHAARNLGVAIAQGDILVFSDPDCRMSPRWLELLVQAQRGGHPAAGGSVSDLGGGWLDLGMHLCKYAWWLPGGPPGPRTALPSANVSYSRDLFARIGPFPEEWCGDTVLAWRGTAAGATLWFEPAAIVEHDHCLTWDVFLRQRFERGYDFGQVRPRVAQWTTGRTLAYLLATPLTGAVMTARAIRYAAEAAHLGLMLRCLPIVFAGYSAWGLGEAVAHWRALRRR